MSPPPPDHLELRRTRRGPVVLTLLAPDPRPGGGVTAPLACLHAPIRPGTRLQHEMAFYRTPQLSPGMNRPPGGVHLEPWRG